MIYMVSKVELAVLTTTNLFTCPPKHPIADSSRRNNYEMRDILLVSDEVEVASYAQDVYIEFDNIDRGLYTSQTLRPYSVAFA